MSSITFKSPPSPSKSQGNSVKIGTSSLSRQVHDLLSLGEIAPALSGPNFLSSSHDERSPNNALNAGGLRMRLPLLLRWLSIAQPLVLISSSSPLNVSPLSSFSQSAEELEKNEEDEKPSSIVPNPDSIAPLLEDVAAAHPDAENVEVLVSTLAPSVCRNTVEKCSLLSRSKVENLFRHRNIIGKDRQDPRDLWNTESLDAALVRLLNQGRSPSQKRQLMDEKSKSRDRAGKKRKLESNKEDANKYGGGGDGDDIITTADEDDDQKSDSSNRKYHRKISEKQEEEEVDLSNVFVRASSAADDSHESAMRRALQELIVLVSLSLPTLTNASENAGDGGGGAEKNVANENREGDDTRPSPLGASNFSGLGFTTPGISLKSDSLFLEAGATSASIGGGWSGLSVMVPALMHHSPILRHEHVANALCRAAVPQAPALIAHMAANCPAASPCLFRGTIRAYRVAETFKSLKSEPNAANFCEEVDALKLTPLGPDASDIIRTTIESAKGLASLSRREALHAVRVFKEARVMNDLVLTLLVEHDPVGLASYIVEDLSVSLEPVPKSFNRKEDSDENKPKGAQDPNDPSEENIFRDARGFRRRRMKRRHPLQLRQRMITFKTVGISTPDSIQAQRYSSSLLQSLIQNKSLAERARRCISKHLKMMLASKEQIESNSIGNNGAPTMSLGEATLFIHAYALLVHRIGIGAGSSAGSGSKFVEDSMISIRSFSDFVRHGTIEPDIPERSSAEDAYKMAMCASIITCSKFPPIGGTKNAFMGGPAVKACFECFQNLLLHPNSLVGTVFASRVAGSLTSENHEHLLMLAIEQIYSQKCCIRGVLSKNDEIQQASNVCRWLTTKMNHSDLKRIQQLGLSLESVLADPMALVDAMRKKDVPASSELDCLIKNIFADPCVCARMIRNPHVGLFIQEGVNMLNRNPAPHIPLVLPLSLERLWQSIKWEKLNAKVISDWDLFHQFILQLFYAMLFLDAEETSPFAINPRSFPLRETLSFLNAYCKTFTNDKDTGLTELHVALGELILKHCPEIFHTATSDAWLSQSNSGHLVGHEHIATPMMVCQCIRECLDESKPSDPSGLRAEKMFLLCRSVFPWSELDIAVVGAVLSSSRSQPKFYSYAALCKDPLVIFKAKASVWKCKGVRCIMLRVLKNLMDANDCIAKKCSMTETVAIEFLAARDAIIVRCILFACQHGFQFSPEDVKKTRTHCVMCVNLVRSIVSLRRGLVATLVKQGLPDSAIDWLVEFVPESFLDAQALLSLLSERRMLTATERLTSASAVLRIAVSNSSRGEVTARSLVSASLAVLIDSFYLVIGPVGVPVSVLRDDSGDLTSISRKAMSRMIFTLSSISGKQTGLRNEAIIALSKIASFCKSESAVGGVAGLAASKRKKLLKEIWEKCTQANAALGGSLLL